jgi:hypothetical protein
MFEAMPKEGSTARLATRAMGVAAVLASTLIGARAASAAPWDRPGNPGHSTQEEEPYIRSSDRAESRPAPQQPSPLWLPGLPGSPVLGPKRPGTKTGPMTMDDLHLIPDGKGGFRGRRPGYRFSIDPDGTIHFSDRPPVEFSPAFLWGMVGMVATFDLTDLVMRLHGDDPYSYDKAKVIGLTRDMRTRMTDTERARWLRQAVRDLPRQLELLWARADLTAQARRALLFHLWDELLDDTSSPEGKAAAEARNTIREFVRKRLPSGLPAAYPAAELAELNAHRRSREAFAPYER